MGWEAGTTLIIIAGCFILVTLNRLAPYLSFLGGVTILLILGIISPQQALLGFSNEGMFTVAILYIVVAGLKETGAIGWIVNTLLGHPQSIKGAQLRLMLPTTTMSAFLNNTPIVAMMIPAINEWSKRFGLCKSKLMIPLSYAAIAGGTCTLIGTSTNLVVNGLIIDTVNNNGLGLFELSWVGLPIVITVVIFVTLTSRWLLPNRKTTSEQFADAREYTVEMLVEESSPLIDKTIEEAGLRHLHGMYLIEIDRKGIILPAVSPHEKLMESDRLIFAGVVESIKDLQKIRGLIPATNQVFKLDTPRPERCLVEAVVSDRCPLIGKSIREGRFRSLYSAAVIAVSRGGEQLKVKLGDIVIRPGDTLLIEAHPSFIELQRNSRDFFLVSGIPDSNPLRHDRALIAAFIMLAMIVTVTVGWLSLFKASAIAAVGMLLAGCTTPNGAKRSVDWQVLMVIAASFGIGQAMQTTGAASLITDTLLGFSQQSPTVALVMIYIITSLVTAMITNNAAAVLMFPIALASSTALGVSFWPFVITVMLAASASFATPISYQTNLMVYGPGGYKFSDFLKIGVPLNIVVGCITVVVVPIVWPF